MRRKKLVDKGPGDFANVDEVAGHVEKLVEGWASVIRCKAALYGGAPCDRIMMVVFLDFFQPPPEGNYCVWDSGCPMLCEDCATDLRLLDVGAWRFVEERVAPEPYLVLGPFLLDAATWKSEPASLARSCPGSFLPSRCLDRQDDEMEFLGYQCRSWAGCEKIGRAEDGHTQASRNVDPRRRRGPLPDRERRVFCCCAGVGPFMLDAATWKSEPASLARSCPRSFLPSRCSGRQDDAMEFFSYRCRSWAGSERIGSVEDAHSGHPGMLTLTPAGGAASP